MNWTRTRRHPPSRPARRGPRREAMRNAPTAYIVRNGIHMPPCIKLISLPAIDAQMKVS